MKEVGGPAGDTLIVKEPSSSTLLGAAERCDLRTLVNALDRGVCADVCDPDTVRISVTNPRFLKGAHQLYACGGSDVLWVYRLISSSPDSSPGCLPSLHPLSA